MNAYDIRPLTADLWPAFEALFGKSGACAGCWCMYWRLERGAWGTRASARNPRNKKAFRKLVETGPAPGLLAFDADDAVGWVTLGPREDFPALDRSRFNARVDDESVWSMPCFYIKPSHRGRGVMTTLIDAAGKYARSNRAKLLEAYPIEPGKRLSNGTVFTGVASAFQRAGYQTVARPGARHRIVRKDVSAKKSVAAKKSKTSR